RGRCAIDRAELRGAPARLAALAGRSSGLPAPGRRRCTFRAIAGVQSLPQRRSRQPRPTLMTDLEAKPRRLRWSTLAEVLALGLGCLVLGYFTCRDGSTEPSRERSSRVFSAPRDPGSGSSDAEQARRELELWLGG